MIVKICGITRVEDALAAADRGAHAIGLVFWPGSPRYVDPHRARQIVAALPPFVTPVGVFVNQGVDHVNAVARLVGLGAVQLHGDETPDAVAAMRVPAMKAIGVGERFDPATLDDWPARTLILLDVHDPSARGGTGRTIDWTAAAAAARRRSVILAGGLAPENIREAVETVRPFGVDVSSGVEARPGIKDARRLDALFQMMTSHGDLHSPARS